MNQPLSDASLFLIQTVFDLYLVILTVRLILAYRNARYFNPVIQVIIRLTQPLVHPLRRLFPTIHRIESATLVCMFIIALIKFYLIGLLTAGIPKLSGLSIMTVADLLKLILNTFFYAIFIQALLSWVQQSQSPVGDILEQMTTPILRPFRRVIPLLNGFDLSPIPAMIFLQLVLILLINPLFFTGQQLAFS